MKLKMCDCSFILHFIFNLFITNGKLTYEKNQTYICAPYFYSLKRTVLIILISLKIIIVEKLITIILTLL